MDLIVNPPDALSTLPCLNACFPNWGDERMFRWAYQRAMQNQPAPDYLLLKQDGQLLAGSGVSYRQVLLPGGGAVTAGIMTGSWTLPAARGRGCFTRMIEESMRMVKLRGGALLLAFVTEDNPSCRQLLRTGGAKFPTAYFFSPDALAAAKREETSANRAPAAAWQRWDSVSGELIDRWMTAKHGFVCFGYAGAEDWRAQMIDRPAGTMIFGDGDQFAVLEEHGNTRRLQAYLSLPGPAGLLVAIMAETARSRRKLFLFSTDPQEFEFCRRSGLAEKPGFLTAHVADWAKLAAARHRATPDAPPPHSVIADPASPWFLGEWRLQSGDRM
jgi:GNAT superfamily N-acetyltransferase